MKKTALYRELASIYPLLTPREDYEIESGVYARAMEQASEIPIHSVLELGCGGGHNASYLKEKHTMTLVDLSPEMLALSEKLNPECEHLVGDMRDVRLGIRFDAVFIHDAVAYITTEEDLAKVARTAYEHLKPGGVVLLCPDQVAESFREQTSHGGHDGLPATFRFLEWSHDPDTTDTEYVVDFAFMVEQAGGEMEVVHDRHYMGLFTQETWLRVLAEQGFEAHSLCLDEIEEGDYTLMAFVGVIRM